MANTLSLSFDSKTRGRQVLKYIFKIEDETCKLDKLLTKMYSTF